MKKKIVITGMGAVTPIGSGVDEYWNNLIAGACGIDQIRRLTRMIWRCRSQRKSILLTCKDICRRK